MRVYVPATTTMLGELDETKQLGPAPLTAFAVTPGLRGWYVRNDADEDQEELEYAACVEAARGSLRPVDADAAAARRRVVVAVDVPDSSVEVRDDLDRGVVQLTAAVPLADVASVHVDDADAEATIAAAAEAVIAADLGDSGSQEQVDDAEGFELGWYASQEIGDLLAAIRDSAT